MVDRIGVRPGRRTVLGLGVGLLVLAAALTVDLTAGGAASARQPHPLVADSSQLAPISPTIPAQMSCSGVTGLTGLAALPDYPTSVDSATDVPAAAGNPRYCDIKGLIAPQTHFEMKLPDTSWQGRYLQNGCGGYCGTVNAQNFPSCDAQLGGDFAMATDDEGHGTSSGLGGAGLFAFNDQKLRDEYGYQSEQALYVVARAIIKAYYGRSPNYTYYDGCSDGGREAMEMAERYPDDFNGIIAGAPEIIAGPLNAELQTWQYRVNTDSSGDAILTSAQIPALHRAVEQACAGDDGVSERIITDPRICHFDPASIQCPANQPPSTSCLTPAQVQAAREIYQGPLDEHGRRLYPGGLAYGSEYSWPGFVIPVDPSGAPVSSKTAAVYGGLSLPYLRYQLLPPGQLGPDPSRWPFNDAAFREMFPVANTYDAMDTNLSAFRRRGGKLIIWHGWADQAIPTFGTVDYYDTLVSRMGGLAATQRFARMFLFPTVAHCGGGFAASSFDLVYPMVQWAERGLAPAQVTATNTEPGTATPFTRPVYPYPLIPKYKGSGDPGSAASFHPVRSPDARQYTRWIGDYLFHQPVSAGR